MRLHENEQLFRQAIQFTAQEMGIPEIFVEKDYWVTFALYTIFKSDVGAEAVFKGGTSLLKCYGLIKRLSEDIDLVVLRGEGESNNKLTNKIKAISEIVSSVLPEVSLPEVTVKMGMNRKTAHEYKKLFTGDFGQIRDKVIVEATWLGYFEPYSEMSISSFIYEMMIKRGQEGLAKEYNLIPFNAKVLAPERTICEKIMSLVRFSYGEDPIQDLRLKVRHAYDLHQLLNVKQFSDFFYSEKFMEMLLKVGQDDVASYKSNNQWLKNHPNEAIIFKDLDSVWNQIKGAYNSDFRAMVFGDDFPSDEKVLVTLHRIRERLAQINWTIKVSDGTPG
jgi:predicted nucleotidyltransferase component of viral defense system